MKTEQILINGLSGNEIIFREGKARDEFIPKPMSLSGNIDSPLQFIKRKKFLFPVIAGAIIAHLLVNREKMSLTLVVEPKSEAPDTIVGSLVFHEDFVKFGINSGEQMQPSELAELIKMNRSCFSSRETAMGLVSELKSFKAKVDKQLEKVVDDRANYTLHKSQAVESNIPETFKLTVAIFKGQPKETIEVEININADNFGCSLISPEANDFIAEHKNRIIEDQLAAIAEELPDLCVIEV